MTTITNLMSQTKTRLSRYAETKQPIESKTRDNTPPQETEGSEKREIIFVTRTANYGSMSTY